MKPFLRCIAILLALLILTPALPAGAETDGTAVVSVRTSGAIVRVTADREITAYCITAQPVEPPSDHPDWRPVSGTSFTAFKTDGSYYVRVRDAEGGVSKPAAFTVRSSYRYVLEAEGQDHLTEPIGEFLTSHGDSIASLNRRIAASALAGGLYTRAGVAAAAMRFMTDLSGHGMTLSYQPSGNFTKEDDWGVSPEWGVRMKKTEKDKAGTYRVYGMNCGTIIVWAYKQAGLNLGTAAGRRKIFDSGMHSRRDDNLRPLDAGDTGDIIATKTGHTMMILDRADADGDGLSDSYLVLEMESPYLKLKLRSLYSIRMCKLYDMSAVFDDSGVLKDYTQSYTGSFRIPLTSMPAVYRRTPFKPAVYRQPCTPAICRQTPSAPRANPSKLYEK